MTTQSQDVEPSGESAEKSVRNDLWVAVFFLALGGGLMAAGIIAPAPRIEVDMIGPYGFAIVVGALIAVAAAIVVVRDLYLLRSADPSRAVQAIQGRPDDEPEFSASAVRATAMMAATGGYAVLLQPIGYILTSILFVSVGLRLMEMGSWKLILTNAVIFTIITYAMFGLLLGVPLPLGPLEALFVELNLVERVR